MNLSGRLVFLLAVLATASGETLDPRTLQEFEAYMAAAEGQMSGQQKLWAESRPDAWKKVQSGQIPTSYHSGKKPREVTDGLIHDWVGTVFVPGKGLQDGLTVLRDYGRHSKIYAPEMVSSRKVSSTNGTDWTTVRLLKKKIITVVLEADFELQTTQPSPKRAQIRSFATRIAEVSDAGKPDEVVKPPDTGHGFLWRLKSWYVLEERPEGLYVELRSISLTRGIPFGLGHIIGPMVNSLPEESLVSTLRKTRDAIQALR